MGYDLKQHQVLVRYGEIALKSPGIRRHLETLLTNHLQIMMSRKGVSFEEIVRERGRFFIITKEPKKTAEIAAQVFGIVSTSPVWSVASTLKDIETVLTHLTPTLIGPNQRFAIRARRMKSHDFTSQDVAQLAGKTLLEVAQSKNWPVQVDLDQPDVEVHIEVRQKHTYIFTDIIPGPSGLPYGSQGTIVGLHSGGIDSPVAQWLMMKRGCRVVPIYLNTELPKQKELLQRALATAKILANWNPEKNPELLIVPYRTILERFQKINYPKLTCVLCKRMMYRIATAIARQENAQAIVTGETLGQVASQTLTNITVLDQATSLTIFRPLIGMDKTETMDLARRIGTYEISGKDLGECFAVPSQPSIQSHSKEVGEAESSLDIEELIQQSLTGLRRVKLR